MEKKIKIEEGTELTIRSDLNQYVNLKFGVTEEMETLAGRTCKVTNYNGALIEIDLDSGKWKWSLGMFSEYTAWIKYVLDKHSKWFRNEDGGEYANLSGTNLSGTNLSGANLYFADLRGADLSYANLRDANLCNAFLRGANLHGVDLSDANLKANLSDANLRGADLSYANLSGANLYFADLRGADLSYANLSGSNLHGAYLSGANLRDGNNELVIIKKVMFIEPVGSKNDTTQIICTTDNRILIKCEYFYGYIEEFEIVVYKKHEQDKYKKQYIALIELAKAMVEE